MKYGNNEYTQGWGSALENLKIGIGSPFVKVILHNHLFAFF